MLRDGAAELAGQVDLVHALEPLVARGEGLPEVRDQGVVPAPLVVLVVSRSVEVEVPGHGVLTPGGPVGQRGLGEVEARDTTDLPLGVRRSRSVLRHSHSRGKQEEGREKELLHLVVVFVVTV